MGSGVVSHTSLDVVFAEHRDLLFGLCYRMCGCGADAEDLVQDTFERALRKPPADTERDLLPWLTRVAINACLDHLRRRRRRGYEGPWLPGPVEASLDDAHADRYTPEARYSALESMSFAFLLAIEALTPSQRAVLLLRDVFDLSVRETAAALETSEANVKTTLHRARKTMDGYDRARAVVTPARQEAARRALEALLVHLLAGNMEAVRQLLAEDVVALNDGGGRFIAARKPVVGRARVLTFLRKTMRHGIFKLAWTTLNGEPALLLHAPYDKPNYPETMVLWLSLDDAGRIAQVASVFAPRKLERLPWDTLALPTLAELVRALRSAAAQPPPRSWLLPVTRDLVRRLGRGRRRRKRSLGARVASTLRAATRLVPGTSSHPR